MPSLRPREYLTPDEMEKLQKVAREGRYGHRDATLILVALSARPEGDRDLRPGMVTGRNGPGGYAARPPG